MPRGVYDRGAKAKKSKVAKVKVAKQHDPEKRHNGGLLAIAEHSIERRWELCDLLDRNLTMCEDLLKQLDEVWRNRSKSESFLKSAVTLLRRLNKWSAGKPIDQGETELIAVLSGVTALLNEMDRKFDPS